jgi:hypothetical protein
LCWLWCGLLASYSSTKIITPIIIIFPTAGAQGFLMDYLQGERATTHHVSPVRIGTCEQMQINSLTFVSEHGVARDNIFFHLMTDQRCLAFAFEL